MPFNWEVCRKGYGPVFGVKLGSILRQKRPILIDILVLRLILE